MILRTLISNDDYLRKVIPFIKSEYFTDKIEQTIFNEINSFTTQYNNAPTIESISIIVNDKNSLSDLEVENCEKYLKQLVDDKNLDNPDIKWLLDKTEKFCQEKAIYNAVLGSISILDGKDKLNDKGAIPKILSDALSISFDNSVGHDYLQDSDERYEFYHKKEERIPFDLEYFNKITKGGLPRKTLNIALAGTGVGKSLFMCHMAAGAMTQGYNVLYITMEMAEEKIAERIDANLLNVTIDDLLELPKELYDKKVSRIKEKTTGKLIIKEYPTATVSSTHFRTLLNELNLKRNFIPDIIFIDYLNICTSSRIKAGANINSYTYVKSIAEELRGLAVEFNVPVVSATQTTRSGFCLDVNTYINEKNKGDIKLSEVKIGDELASNSGYNIVKTIFDMQNKKVYKITTESGKEIICSEQHMFPTTKGEKSLASGLCINDEIFVNS